MLSILCFIESLEAGGAQRQLISLAALLKEKGHHPVIVTYYPNNFYSELLASKGIEHVFLENAISRIGRLSAFWKLIKKRAPDVVVCFEETASMYLCLIRRFLDFTLIVSERNATLEPSITDRLRFQLYRIADEVVCNSMSKTKFLKAECPFLASKTHTIINCLDTDTFKPLPTQRRSEEKRLLVLARVVPQKNVERFIKALRDVKSDGYRLTVDWHGQPIEPYHTSCQQLIEQYGLGDMLHIYPPVSGVEKIYNQYDGLCLPSIYEGFPNVIGEAMSCGLPILCGIVCDNGYLVGDGGNFLFDPYDYEDMRNQIEAFCRTDGEQLSAIGRRNRERAVKIFSSSKFVNEYLKLMER